MTVEDFPPRPRHCTIKKWSDFDGYGFNLHAEKNKPGQFIGKVDPYSPSEAAGLKEFDKIIEVNGVNISQENHKQVVQRIKADPNQTSLLVLDAHTEAHFKEKGIIVTGQLSCVHYMTSDKADKDFEEIDTRMQVPSPKYGRDSPDSDIVRNDHSSDVRMKIGREDSLNSERTLSNRSSVSSTQDKSERKEDTIRDSPPPSYRADVSSPDHEAASSPEPPRDGASAPEPPQDGAEAPGSPTAGPTTDNDEPEDSGDDEDEEVDLQAKIEGVPPSPPPEIPSSPPVFYANPPVIPSAPPVVDDSSSSSSSSDDEEDKPVSGSGLVADGGGAGIKSPSSFSSGSPRSTPSPINSVVSPHRDERPGSVRREEEISRNREGGLDLPLTAKEMRERIVSKKKRDPRRDDRMDFRKKYEIIQTL